MGCFFWFAYYFLTLIILMLFVSSSDNTEVEVPTSVRLDDEVKRLTSFKVTAARSKVSSFDLVSIDDNQLKVMF